MSRPRPRKDGRLIAGRPSDGRKRILTFRIAGKVETGGRARSDERWTSPANSATVGSVSRVRARSDDWLLCPTAGMRRGPIGYRAGCRPPDALSNAGRNVDSAIGRPPIILNKASGTNRLNAPDPPRTRRDDLPVLQQRGARIRGISLRQLRDIHLHHLHIPGSGLLPEVPGRKGRPSQQAKCLSALLRLTAPSFS